VKALLLYPEFPETFWSFKHALKYIRKHSSLPPLGLLTLAAMLPQEWEKRLVDTNIEELEDGDLAWADLVCVSAMIAQKDSVRALIARCRAAGKTILAGGPLFTSAHEEYPEVDYFVLNEAELTLPEFLRDFALGKARRVYATDAFADLRTTPVPLWSLAKLKRYGSMCLQYSRGCPFDCEFCDVTAKFGHLSRTKAPAQITAELDALYAAGWRGSVFFVDDNLIGNKRALRTELLPALLAWQGRHGRGLPFYTEASINIADDEKLMQLMSQAGFDTLFIGIETPSKESLIECNKIQNQGRDLVADVKKIQRAGLQVQGGFIVGFDNDTQNIFQRQVEFIQKSGIVMAMVGMLNALPGTRLHQRLKQEGRLVEESSGNNSDGSLNFIPRMSKEQLVEGYRSILRGIYSPAPYYRRIRVFLREYKRPSISVPLRWIHLWALVRSGLCLGVLGRERFQYWYLMVWTLFRRPSQLPLAITLAVYGQHFRLCAAAACGD
jgi:radical SAM superfamily enzyme YgiQ (UPF0313 family)